MKYIVILLTFFCLFSCDEKKPETITQPKVETLVEKMGEDNYELYKDSLINSDSELLEIRSFVEKHKPNYDDIPYTFVWNDQRYYMPTKGQVQTLDNGSKHFELIGLVDSNNNAVLPIEFDRIHTPDKILQGFIEVRKKGRQGLVSRDGDYLLKPNYTRLYPGFNDYLVCTFGEDGYGYLDLDTTYHIIKNEEEIEFMAELFSDLSTKKWQFNVNNEVPFRSVMSIIDFAGEPDASGYLCPPQFLVDYGFIKNELTDVIVGDEEYFGEANTNIEVYDVSKDEKGFWTFIGKFIMEIPESRGYVEERRVLTTVNNEHAISNVTFTQEKDFNLCNDSLVFKKLNDTIFEAKCQEWGKGDFQAMESYKYYSINRDEIVSLSSDRMFPFTKFVVIDSSYFYGCWRKNIPENEIEEDINLIVYNHLTIEDLDVMRNEIYAEYGLKFKTTKWSEFFSNFDWYSPKSENVDELLTEIDKANIKFILEYKKRMKFNENGKVKIDSIGWSAAG